MVTEIYADVLVVLNFILTFLLLLCTVSVLHIMPNVYRLFFGSLFGGLSSLVIFLPELILPVNILLKISLALIITAISFKCSGLKYFFKCFGIFISMNILFAGAVFFVINLFSPRGISMNNGSVYIDLNFLSLIITAVISFVLISFYNRYTLKQISSAEIYKMTVYVGNKSFSCDALYDTGNNLTDGYFASPVAVVSFDSVKNFVPYELVPFFSGEIYDIYECSSIWLGRIRFIPAVTVSGESLLPCFRCDRVELDTGKDTYVTYRALIAVTVKGLKNETYSALVGQNMFSDNIKGDRNENKTKDAETKTVAGISGNIRKGL